MTRKRCFIAPSCWWTDEGEAGGGRRSGDPESQGISKPFEQGMVARIAIIVGALSFASIIVMPVVQQGQVFELAAAVSTLTRGEASSPESPPAPGAGISSEPPGGLATLDDESRSRWEASLEEGRRASLEELAEKVHLSSVQVELLYDLFGTEQERMLEVFREVREDGLPMADARARVEVIRTATDQEVDAELDDDQFSGYEEMRPVYRVGGPPPGRR